ncbi:unnamed protein product [Vicia faba]|uniref:Uncharacterized protein n=1 Tax=Vicia faba TaxID=3906 RepID=A0AAV0YNF6_VICFA|nr:unnamed protein product [Vicia faba]
MSSSSVVPKDAGDFVSIYTSRNKFVSFWKDGCLFLRGWGSGYPGDLCTLREEILGVISITHSQLFPNNWGYIMDFKMVCEKLNINMIVWVFSLFLLPSQRKVVGRPWETDSPREAEPIGGANLTYWLNDVNPDLLRVKGLHLPFSKEFSAAYRSLYSQSSSAIMNMK